MIHCGNRQRAGCLGWSKATPQRAGGRVPGVEQSDPPARWGLAFGSTPATRYAAN